MNRDQRAFAGQEGVLLMSNYPNRISDQKIEILSRRRSRVIKLAPHIMNIFHVLDLCLCGTLKTRGRYELPFSDDDEAARFTTKVCHNFR
jgi:hypothetical protein